MRERLFAQQRPQRRSTNVNVRVVVGAPVPRGLSLAVLPPVIIEEVPEFRGYRYGWVRDEIVIVDPGTNRVVEVFERGGERARNAGSGGGARELQLSEAEQRLVYDALINEFDPVDNVRVRLGLGVSIPRNVELDRFPRRLVEQIAALKEHRFVIVDREVVIVDPRNREIVLLVDDR